ncbi:lytic transglycosylase F [Bacteroidia bacterium]|nr:lytic transglycosylase F [Bacteroidia bacterium]
MKNALVIVTTCIVLLTACNRQNKRSDRDWGQILKQDTLNVLTLSGSMSYFVYQGEAMGYEYELLRDFCDNYGLNIKVQVVENEEKLMQLFQQGEGDLIAYNIPITKESKKKLIFCGRKVSNSQVLVQRSTQKKSVLHDVTDLVGKEVWVTHNSKQYRRLQNLNDELGGGIRIRVVNKDTVTAEDLIEMVAKGKLDYTVSDVDLAKFSKTYFRNLNVSVPVSHPQGASWAVRKSALHLAMTLNIWFEENWEKPVYYAIVKRNFKMSQQPADRMFPTEADTGKISPYDDLFQKYAPRAQWDWRLLAAIAYQESEFYPDPISWKGASGLMGLMPITAREFGLSLDSLDHPESNVRTAAEVIRKLNRTFSHIPEKNNQRLQFILAAYNAGPRKIKNPDYLRSQETVNYVQEVIERWEAYNDTIE